MVNKLFSVSQVCKLLTEHADTVTTSGRLPGSQAPYVVDGSRWTGYDDAQSIREKVGADILSRFLILCICLLLTFKSSDDNALSRF